MQHFQNDKNLFKSSETITSLFSLNDFIELFINKVDQIRNETDIIYWPGSGRYNYSLFYKTLIKPLLKRKLEIQVA